MRSLLHKVFFTAFTSLLSVSVLAAQVGNCSELVTVAFQTLEETCDEIGRNEVCYGYNFVEASFQDNVSDNFFTQVSDIAKVEDLINIHTSAMNLEDANWGIALMNLQANLPNTLPGQNVTFVLLGDVEVENAVAAEDIFEGTAAIEISLAVESANLRSGPSLNFNVIAGMRRGESLPADAISEDGAWLRVVKNNRPAWVSRDLVLENSQIDSLPRLNENLRTPMQSFYLRTGIGQTFCEALPEDILLVQGPHNIEIQITVNGANIRLGSSGALRIIEQNGQEFLEITVFDGEFEVEGVRILAGERSLLCLGNEASRGLDGISNDRVVTCAPSPPERIPRDEFGEIWCNIESIPQAILHYPIEILCPGESPAPIQQDFTGDGGATDSEVASVNCNGFSLVSPLLPVDSGNHEFDWTPAGGENIRYQLVFYDFSGREVESFFSDSTSIIINLGTQTSTGGVFSWEVRAFQNGNYACVTYRSPQLSRIGAPVVAGLSASKNCSSPIAATISWENSDGSVTIRYTGSLGTDNTITRSGKSGSTNINNGLGYNFINSITVSSAGSSISLGGCP